MSNTGIFCNHCYRDKSQILFCKKSGKACRFQRYCSEYHRWENNNQANSCPEKK